MKVYWVIVKHMPKHFIPSQLNLQEAMADFEAALIDHDNTDVNTMIENLKKIS